jgi:hypothetical protein
VRVCSQLSASPGWGVRLRGLWVTSLCPPHHPCLCALMRTRWVTSLVLEVVISGVVAPVQQLQHVTMPGR